jgi:hypothetical protein
MNQGVAIYTTFACDVFLICWFGTQLTQHVRENEIIVFLKHYVYNAQQPPLSGNHSFLSALAVFLYYQAVCSQVSGKTSKKDFKHFTICWISITQNINNNYLHF